MPTRQRHLAVDWMETQIGLTKQSVANMFLSVFIFYSLGTEDIECVHKRLL